MLLVKYTKFPLSDLFHISPLLHFPKEQENAGRWMVDWTFYNQNYYQIISKIFRNCSKTITQDCWQVYLI